MHPKIGAQVPRAKGLIFNAIEYKKRSTRGARGIDNRVGLEKLIPIKISLRPFCPKPQDQGQEPSCTAWAIAYAAMTIQQAVAQRINNSEDIDKMACSKSFVYNQLVEKNKGGIPSVEETISFLQSKGTCLASTFNNHEPIGKKPDSLAILEAKEFSLGEMKEVFVPDSSMSWHIRLFKRFLKDSIPIVVGLRLPAVFSPSNKRFEYDPEIPQDTAAHAMCLIGYDEQDSTFELMNSWGTNWGDSGFVSMRYKDMIRLLCCAYRLPPYFWVKKADTMKGVLVLRQSRGYDKQNSALYEEIRVQYDTVHKYYKTTEPIWPVGSSFQLVLRQTPPNWWVYVVNINKKGAVSNYYQGNIKAGVIGKTIPNGNTNMELDGGVEWLYILYTKDPVPDFTQMLKSNPTFNPQNRNPLDDITKDAQLTSKRMGFSFSKKTVPKGALIILKLEAQE